MSDQQIVGYITGSDTWGVDLWFTGDRQEAKARVEKLRKGIPDYEILVVTREAEAIKPGE